MLNSAGLMEPIIPTTLKECALVQRSLFPRPSTLCPSSIQLGSLKLTKQI